MFTWARVANKIASVISSSCQVPDDIMHIHTCLFNMSIQSDAQPNMSNAKPNTGTASADAATRNTLHTSTAPPNTSTVRANAARELIPGTLQPNTGDVVPDAAKNSGRDQCGQLPQQEGRWLP